MLRKFYAINLLLLIVVVIGTVIADFNPSLFPCFHGIQTSSQPDQITQCQCHDNRFYGGIFCSNCLSNEACQDTHDDSNLFCDKSMKTFNTIDQKVFNCKVVKETFSSVFPKVELKPSEQFTMAYYCAKNNQSDCQMNVYKSSSSESSLSSNEPFMNCALHNCKQMIQTDHVLWSCDHSVCNTNPNIDEAADAWAFLIPSFNGPSHFYCGLSNEVGDHEGSCFFEKEDMKLRIETQCYASECMKKTTNEEVAEEPPSTTIPYNNQVIIETSTAIVGIALAFLVFVVLHFSYTRYENYYIMKEWKAQNEALQHSVFDFSFQDVSYTITSGWFKRTKRRILDGVYGSVKQGQICAIMGASGAGKSSLLDILAGRKKGGIVTGDVFVGSKPIDHRYQLLKGYVLQENIMMATMTVHEYLMMNAQLRLPEHVPHEEKESRVQAVMEQLGIQHLSNRRIGSNIKRGLSGGEKRRVALGAELVISKPIIFCDEITSGLDSYNAHQVMLSLHNLARNHNKTIILSIHQPSSAIFDLIDKLVLLSEGKVVFSGDADKAIQHFESIGFDKPEDFNVPDFMLDLVVGASVAKKGRVPKSDVFSTILRKRRQNVSSNNNSRYATTYEDVTNSSSDFMELPKFSREEMRQGKPPILLTGDSVRYTCQNGLYNTSIYKQLLVLSGRAFKNFIRNIFLFPGHLFFSVCMGLILGGIFYKLPLDLTGTQNRIGVFFFLTVVLSLVSMSSLEIFIAEREVYLTERASGYYRALAYYISRMIFDVVPLRIIPPIVLSSCCYFLVGLRTDHSVIFVWFVTYLTLFNIAMGGICLCISSVVHSVTVGNMIFLCYNLFTMLFGGFLINIRFLPFALGLFQYISPYRYTLESLLVNELQGRIILFNPQGSIPVKVPAEEIIKFFGFSQKNEKLNLGCLFGLSTTFILAAAILLQFCVREKR